MEELQIEISKLKMINKELKKSVFSLTEQNISLERERYKFLDKFWLMNGGYTECEKCHNKTAVFHQVNTHVDTDKGDCNG